MSFVKDTDPRYIVEGTITRTTSWAASISDKQRTFFLKKNYPPIFLIIQASTTCCNQAKQAVLCSKRKHHHQHGKNVVCKNHTSWADLMKQAIHVKHASTQHRQGVYQHLFIC